MTSIKSISARIARNARPREHDIRMDLDERVASYGGETRAMSYLGRIGCPDVLCLFPPSKLRQRPTLPLGTAVWVETKQVKGKLAKLQAEEHAVLRAAGQDVRVIVTRDDLNAFLPELPF